MGSRLCDQDAHRELARLRRFVLAAEHLLARPEEIRTMRLPQLKIVDYAGRLGASTKLWSLETTTTKGSRESTIPLRRSAIRHRSIQACAIGALAEQMYVLFQDDMPLDTTATVDSHTYADVYKMGFSVHDFDFSVKSTPR